MINGTTVIKAKDTTTAMEKVVNQLGEDCVILSTKKEEGQIIITASNSSKVKSSVKKRYDKKKFANIYKLNSGKMNLENKEINTPIKDKKTLDVNLTVDYKKFIQSEMLSLLEKIDKKLENIYITDESNINNKNFSASLKLKQIGFSNNIINKFLIDNNNDDFEEKRVTFFRNLSENLASPFPERIAIFFSFSS